MTIDMQEMHRVEQGDQQPVMERINKVREIVFKNQRMQKKHIHGMLSK